MCIILSFYFFYFHRFLKIRIILFFYLILRTFVFKFSDIYFIINNFIIYFNITYQIHVFKKYILIIFKINLKKKISFCFY